MTDPQLLYDLARMRQSELHRQAANARLASSVRHDGQRPGASVLLPLADACIALGLRLRRAYQPGASLALLPAGGQLPGSFHATSSEGKQTGKSMPVFAFQVIQCVPRHATSYTYWSLMPLAPATGTNAHGLGLICLARPLE